VVKTRFHMVDAAVDASHAFFDRGERHFHVVNIVDSI
jgi:hypothetical protein